MSRDDFHVFVYKILSYLYGCMKSGEPVDLENLRFIVKAEQIPDSYWDTIISEMYKSGYITGVTMIPILNSTKRPRLTRDFGITEKGITYLEENSMMAKAKQFLKDAKDTIPGL